MQFYSGCQRVHIYILFSFCIVNKIEMVHSKMYDQKIDHSTREKHPVKKEERCYFIETEQKQGIRCSNAQMKNNYRIILLTMFYYTLCVCAEKANTLSIQSCHLKHSQCGTKQLVVFTRIITTFIIFKQIVNLIHQSFVKFFFIHIFRINGVWKMQNYLLELFFPFRFLWVFFYFKMKV